MCIDRRQAASAACIITNGRYVTGDRSACLVSLRT
jgi:hypothetical protein